MDTFYIYFLQIRKKTLQASSNRTSTMEVTAPLAAPHRESTSWPSHQFLKFS